MAYAPDYSKMTMRELHLDYWKNRYMILGIALASCVGGVALDYGAEKIEILGHKQLKDAYRKNNPSYQEAPAKKETPTLDLDVIPFVDGNPSYTP